MKIIEEGLLRAPRRMARDLLLFKKGSLEESHENRCPFLFFTAAGMCYYIDLSVFEAGSPGRALS